MNSTLPRNVDLGLHLLTAVAAPGQSYDCDEIAVWCNCSPATIWQMQRSALRHIREGLRQRGVGIEIRDGGRIEVTT